MSMCRSLLAVMTSPRKVSYVAETLRMLDAAGSDHCDSKIVFSDSVESPAVIEGETGSRPWTWLGFPGPSGTREALWRIFWLARASSYDRVYVFEDDVVVCRNLFPYLESLAVPEDVALIMLYDSKECDHGTRPGLAVRPCLGRDRRGLFGTLGVVYPARTVSFLAARDPWNVSYWQHVGRGSADCVMGYLLEDSPWPAVAVHVPSLVDHRGDVSAEAGPGSEVRRRATVFAGMEFDALRASDLFSRSA